MEDGLVGRVAMTQILNPYAVAGTPSVDLTILVWNDHYFEPAYEEPLVSLTPEGSRITVTFTRDRGLLGEADAVWVHAPTLSELPARNEGQPWVLASMEADHNYPFQKGPVAAEMFDITMTYRRHADIPTPYANRHQYGGFRRARRAPHRTDALASFVVSSPVAERDAYVRELMKYIPVASFGKRLRNRSFDEIVGQEPDRGRAAELAIASYGFSLAFENCRDHEYVTEKLYRPLALGTIPVYWGAPDLTGLVPSRDALIEVSQETPAELAEILLAIAGDREGMDERLAWRERPFDPAFEKLLDVGDVDPRARLASKLAHGCDRSCRCGGRLMDGP